MPKPSKKAKVFFCALLSLLLINFISGMAQAAETITWGFTTVDKGVSAADTVGKHLSLYYDSYNKIYTMSYYDETNTALRFAECDDGATDCGDEANWIITTVDNPDNTDVGQYTSIDGKSISYYDATNGNLKFAWYVGGSAGNCTDNNWNCITVDSIGDVGRYTSLTYDPSMAIKTCPNEGAVISYYDVSNSALKFAIKDTADPPQCDDFTIETVDNDTTNNKFDGQYTSIDWDTANNHPTISSYSENSSNVGILRYAKRDSGNTGCTNGSTTKWTCQTVSTSPTQKYGQYTSLAGYEEGGVWIPGISHYDAVDKNLRFAYWDSSSSSWVDTTIDGEITNVGEYTSLAHAPDVWTNGGRWHISYYDFTNLALKYANGPIVGDSGTCFSEGGPSNWDCYKTDNPAPDTGDYGKYTSIVVPPTAKGAGGTIAIGYYNSNNNGDAKITLGKGSEPEELVIPEFKNYWYVAIAAVTALVLFFIVRWQFKKKEVKK